jgi:AcrR family transcriptional regulator
LDNTEKGDRQMAQEFTRPGDNPDGAAVGRFGVLTPHIGVRSQRQRILDAMAKSCAEKTFANTIIADIVSSASISRGTFYKHFNNKQECFYATADYFLVELQGAAAIALTRGEDLPVAAIRDVLRAVLELLAAKPEYAKLLLVEAPIVDPEIVRRYRNVVISALDEWLKPVGGVAPAMADPEIAFGRAKVLVADYVAAGQVESLPSLLPELLYIALLPYAGQDIALAQAQISR